MPKVAKSAGYVHVTNAETGERRVFAPGENVPAEYAKLINNKSVFEEAEVEDVPAAGPSQVAETAEERRARLAAEARAAKAAETEAEKAKAGQQGGAPAPTA